MPSASVGVCASTGRPIDLFYDTFGDPSDEAMLLIMGLGVQMVGWAEAWCKLLAAQGFYVIRFDNRDVGLSTHLDEEGAPNIALNYLRRLMWCTPDHVYTLEDMAVDAIGLLDSLGVGAFHVCGVSMGGMIAQLLTLGHPERVKSLCCIMSTTGEADLPATRLRLMPQLAKPVPEQREKQIQNMLETVRRIAGAYFDELASRQFLETAYDRSAYRGGLPRQMAAILAAPGRRRALAAVRAPTLVIHGREDPMLPPENGVDIHHSVPGSDLMLIDGMGHDIPRPLYGSLTEAIACNARKGSSPAVC